MRSMRLFFILFVLTFISSASAEDYYPDVDRYRLDVSFYPGDSRLEGFADVKFSDNTDFKNEAVFYLHGELWVDSIISAGKSIPLHQETTPYDYEYSEVARKVQFKLNDNIRNNGVTIFYQGPMHASIARSPSNYMRIDRDGVFLRSYGYSMWFPVFLPPYQNDRVLDFEEVVIRTPADFRSVFAGEKIDERFENGRRLTRWRAPQLSLFAAQCTARRYLTTSDGNIVLYHDADTLSVIMAERILSFTEQLLERYEKYYGIGINRQTYYIMELPKYGDISSGNVTGLQQSTWWEFSEKDWAQRGLAHELVHPFVWVRPPRTDRFFSLAVEGFPSYLHLPVLAEILGENWYDEYIRGIEKSYLNKKKTGLSRRGRPLPEEKPILDISAKELGIYKDNFILSDRNALFFNYLYKRMGTEKFFEFTHDLFGQDKVTEKVFRNMIEKYLPGSGSDIDIWLSSNDYPERFTLKSLGMGG